MKFFYLCKLSDGGHCVGFTDVYDALEVVQNLHFTHIRQAVKEFGGIFPVTVLDSDFKPLCVLHRNSVEYYKEVA